MCYRILMTALLVMQYTPKQRPVSFQITDICISIDSHVTWMQILSSSRFWSKGRRKERLLSVPPTKKIIQQSSGHSVFGLRWQYYFDVWIIPMGPTMKYGDYHKFKTSLCPTNLTTYTAALEQIFKYKDQSINLYIILRNSCLLYWNPASPDPGYFQITMVL